MRFVGRLAAQASPDGADKFQRYFEAGPGQIRGHDVFIGVRMREVFALATEFVDTPPGEIERLLDSSVHEVRARPRASS